MQIKFAVSIAGAMWSYAPGELADIEQSQAEKWVASGVAAPAEAAAAQPEETPAQPDQGATSGANSRATSRKGKR